MEVIRFSWSFAETCIFIFGWWQSCGRLVCHCFVEINILVLQGKVTDLCYILCTCPKGCGKCCFDYFSLKMEPLMSSKYCHFAFLQHDDVTHNMKMQFSALIVVTFYFIWIVCVGKEMWGSEDFYPLHIPVWLCVDVLRS